MKDKLKYIGLVVIGLVLGWLFFGGGEPANEDGHDHGTEVSEGEETNVVWTCSMHPQIRKDKPGDCPICGMELIPADNGGGGSDAGPSEIIMTELAIQLGNIQTLHLKKEVPSKTIYLNGTVKPDERLIFSQTAHVPGRIEKLYINFTGERVSKGQKLAAIYSPELITAQKELFELLKNPDENPYLLEAARNKLKLWKFTDKQIKDLEDNNELQTEIDILADHSGFVYSKEVLLGDHVKEGQSLLKIVNMDKVWFMFDAYESDLPWLHIGDEINIHLESLPSENVVGKIKYIDPFINPSTRVASVRVELRNPKTKYKLDMFSTGIVEAVLPISEPTILVPKSAVLWTGKRSVVYVKVPNRDVHAFELREVELGEDAGNFYVVTSGLEEGEEIAVNGVFKIDASAQLAGKPSMMNPEGGKVSTGHDHGGGEDMEGMDMDKMEEEEGMACEAGKCGGGE